MSHRYQHFVFLPFSLTATALQPFTFSSLYRKTITHSSYCTEHNSYAILVGEEVETQTKNIVFRKLISNLPYSPSLITEVGFYANRLRDEDVTRRFTVLFVILAMLVQSLALISPPESANASSEQDIIRGGVSDLNDFLIRYDHNENDIKDIYTALGISRSEIAAAKSESIISSSNMYSMSRYGQLSSTSKEIALSYHRSKGGIDVRYFSPLSATTKLGQLLNGWVGHSAALGWFGIIQANGSLVTRGIPTTLTPSVSNNGQAVMKISSLNLTTAHPSHQITAKPLDKISYTLALSNPNNHTVSGEFTIRIADALEYAKLIDNGGGKYDKENNTLSWGTVELSPAGTQKRTFVIQMMSTMPSTGVGSSNQNSYDCKLTMAFGNSLTTPVECPPAKEFEAVLNQLPRINPTILIGLMACLLLTTLFFYIRIRQIRKELRIIRHNFNAGII
ncbi:hypothetical protein KC953_00120 [Candidatus Saccharibacteria bacterium]|nr:hypothetical protein [Candidatus Saccharibacteria bacterium]